MYRTVDEICRAADEEARNGRLSTALELIAHSVQDVISRESSLARVFSSPQLDQTCLKLGRSFSVRRAETRDPDQVVMVATLLYKFGGHSRVLVDLGHADPCRKVHVLITNLFEDLPQGHFEEILEQVGADGKFTVEVAPVGAAADKLCWLQQRLHVLRPTRTYLLQHHYDSVCIAAAQPELVGQLFYIHHCDHSLALGVHIPYAVHVDLHAKGFYSCRENEDVGGNVLWPLTVRVPEHRVNKPFLVNGHLKTCTSGRALKFDTSYLKEHIQYSISYQQIVPLILRRGDDTHLHIGPLSEQMLRDIRTQLDQARIPQSRFVNIPFVANFASALLEHDIDVYINSFPQGGGRAMVEAMGAGVPLIIHSNYRSMFFSNGDEVYDGAMIWRTPAEFAGHLHQLTEQELRRHSQKARRYFEETHLPEVLRERMHATFEGASQEAPARRRYHPDMLQAFLDEQSARADLLSMSCSEIQKLRDALAGRDAEAEQLRSDLHQRAAEAEYMRAELDLVYNSRSWRLTAPLRACRRFIPKLRRGSSNLDRTAG